MPVYTNALAPRPSNSLAYGPRNLMGTQMLQGPSESYLRQQFPQLYGFLGGVTGTAPDQFQGSVLDPNTAAVRQGAEYGFPVGTALAVLPGAAPVIRATKGLPVGMGIKDVSSVYPQVENLILAQQRAALPVSEGGLGLPAGNTAEQRAAAMGFTDNVFHGSKTPENIKKLVPGGESGSIRTGDAYGTGVYTSTDAAGDASAYGRDGAVFPLKINRSGHLKVDAPNSDDLQKLSKFAGESMLPSDKARFTVGRERREFADVQDARDFFANQRENWNQFGGGYDRARPEALANPDGSFAVEFTNFDASVPITSGNDANTLLRATGWDNVPNLGYSGHTLDMGSNRFWDITTDTDQLRSRFAAFDPFRRSAAIAATMGVAAPDLLAAPASIADQIDSINEIIKKKRKK